MILCSFSSPIKVSDEVSTGGEKLLVDLYFPLSLLFWILFFTFCFRVFFFFLMEVNCFFYIFFKSSVDFFLSFDLVRNNEAWSYKVRICLLYIDAYLHFRILRAGMKQIQELNIHIWICILLIFENTNMWVQGNTVPMNNITWKYSWMHLFIYMIKEVD